MASNTKTDSMTDIGVNLCAKQIKGNVAGILSAAEIAGVCTIVSISNSSKECNMNLELIKKYPRYKIYCTIGVHPHNAKEMSFEKLRQLEKLVTSNRGKVVAIGECGLDFNRTFSPQDIQKEWFEEQIKLAVKHEIALYFHERDAHAEFMEIVSKYKLSGRAVVHCFTGTKGALDDYLKLGYYIGIAGWVCDEKRGEDLRQIIKFIPKERLLIETDSPWLTPIPRRGNQRPEWNEPSNLYYIAETIGMLLNVSPERVISQTTENAKRLFRLRN